MEIRSKTEAQQRIDRIESFRAELKDIERERVFNLDPGQRTSVTLYHDQLLRRLAAAFAVDITGREKQLGPGMRIVGLLGTLGLAVGVFFFFFRSWGDLATKDQVFILVTMPFGATLCSLLALWLDRSGFFARLFATISLVALVLNLVMLGWIFNMAATPQVLLAWTGFAFLLAYGTDSRLLLTMGIIGGSVWLAAWAATWKGGTWLSFWEQPEHCFAAAVLFFLVSWLPHRRLVGFPALYRVCGLLLFFLPVLMLSRWGELSSLDLERHRIEALYQVVGFSASFVMAAVGIWRGWVEVVDTGIFFFTLFLVATFYDRWWDTMATEHFFLVIGLMGLVILLVLKGLQLWAVRQRWKRLA